MSSNELVILLERLGPQRKTSLIEGSLILLGGFALSAFGVFLRVNLDYPLKVPVCGAILLAAALTFREAQKRLRRTAAQVLRRDPRPPILYFRSFGYDEISHSKPADRLGVLHGGGTYLGSRREAIAPMVRHAGPFLAIGQPELSVSGELGPTPVYAENEPWEEVVTIFLRNSAAAIFTIYENSVSDALRWEMARAKEILPIHRIFILPDFRDDFVFLDPSRSRNFYQVLLDVGFTVKSNAPLQLGSVVHYSQNEEMLVTEPERRLRRMYNFAYRADGLHRAFLASNLLSSPPSVWKRPFAFMIYSVIFTAILLTAVLYFDAIFDWFDRIFG
jgi:hypothetical protein